MDESKYVKISLNMRPDVADVYRKIAEKLGITKSQLIREVLADAAAQRATVQRLKRMDEQNETIKEILSNG